MPFSNLNSTAASLRVCVDEAVPGRFSGHVYSQRLTTPIAFSDLAGLLLRLDEVLDAQNFPQAFQKSRSFFDKESCVPAAGAPEEGLPQEEVERHTGAVSTFVLYVLSRRSSSWQGKVDWLDGTTEEFSSALELLNLIENHV